MRTNATVTVKCNKCEITTETIELETEADGTYTLACLNEALQERGWRISENNWDTCRDCGVTAWEKSHLQDHRTIIKIQPAAAHYSNTFISHERDYTGS